MSKRSFFRLRLLFVGALVAAASTAGCMWADDFGDFELSPVLVCAEDALGSGLPVDDTTVGREDDHAGSCGGDASPDVVYQFTAPSDDYYRFSTAGSSFDTVLYLLDDACDGAELACNDDDGQLQTSEIIRQLDAGARVLVVADGKSDEGALHLLAENVSCPSIQLGDDNLPIDHTLVGQSDDHMGGDCGGDGFGDRAYRFRAPEGGLYRFELTSDSPGFVGAVYLEDGPACDAPRLGCNSGLMRLSHVTRRLAADQDVTVRVDGDGSEGGYELDVRRLPDATCIDGVEDDMGTTYMVARDGPHRMTTSCGNTAFWGMGATDPAEIHEYPDLNLTVNHPGAFIYCSLQLNSRFALTAATLSGECGGEEVSCGVSTLDGGSPFDMPTYTTWVDLPSGDDWDSVTLVIDRVIDNGPLVPDYDGPEFTINWLCAVP